MGAEKLITENIDLWTSAIKAKATQGRGNSKKSELYGIKKLRELILELAVRGKLVQQDPNDEPASVLLERIAAEKMQLIKDKKIQKQGALLELTEEEMPFAPPEGWSFIRLGNLARKIGSGSTPRGGQNAYTDSGIPFLRSQNVRNDGLRLDDIAFIPDDTHQKMESTQVFPGDILLNITGASLGRSAIFPENLTEANVSQHVTIIRLIEPQMNRFIHLGILSPMVQRLIWGRQVGMAIEGLSKKVLEQFELPIPPLAEQQRIVAKVDELIALCDQLEQRTEASLDAHQLLVDTLLESLTTAKDASELSENWARLSEHFDTLITTDYAVEQLKQIILRLAVMGKLAPQDPTDVPASELVKCIAAEKEQLVRDKKIKKQNTLPEITDGEKPFSLPSGWEWKRFGDVLINRDAERIPLSADDRRTRQGEFEYYGASGVIDSIDDYLFDTPLLLIGEDGANLISRSTPIAFIAKGKYWVNNHAHVLDGITYELLEYVCMHINAISLLPYITGTAQPKMNQAKMNRILLALPPAEEQVRIIKKVSELLSLCEKLKINLSHAQTTQLHLADAVVYDLMGEPVKNIEYSESSTKDMKITTILSLAHEELADDAIIAPILLELGGSADAKDVWGKTKLSLPEFYAQLKIEIDARYIIKPIIADFKEA